MKNKKYVGSAVLGTLALLALPLAAQADVTRGAVLSSTCFACHGTDGKSSGSIPSIYGIPAEVLSQNMTAFRSGERPSTVMDRHAKGYSDEEIEEIAAYLSAIK